jgi:hypothetical protein
MPAIERTVYLGTDRQPTRKTIEVGDLVSTDFWGIELDCRIVSVDDGYRSVVVVPWMGTLSWFGGERTIPSSVVRYRRSR